MLNQDYFSKEPLPMPWRENGVFSQEVCFDKFKVKGKYECLLIKKYVPSLLSINDSANKKTVVSYT